MIRGYDRPHAVRTARMCVAVATALGHGAERVCQYQVACLLHDLGRAGLDRQLFGKIGPGPRRAAFRRGQGNGELDTKVPPMGAKRRPFSGAIEKVLRPMALR